MAPEISDNELLQRITLTVDASGYSMENIELAVKIATAFNAQLLGLFIEDIDLFRIAELPFTTEITLSTAQERKLDSPTLQRSLRIKSQEFRDRLALTAEKSKIKWSFESVRGRKIETSFGVIRGSGLTIVGQSLSTSHSLSAGEEKKRIILFYDEIAGLLQVLELVLNLSVDNHIELMLVGADRKISASLQQALTKRQKENMHLVMIPEVESELQQKIRGKRLATDYVIASRRNASDVLRWMIENSVCPVILLG